jgi:hypothetical protein
VLISNTQDFLQSLIDFETEMEGSITEEAADFQQALALVTDERRTIQAKPLNKRVAGDSISVVCTYRLVDILYDLKMQRGTYPRPIHAKSSAAGLRPNSTVYFPKH